MGRFNINLWDIALGLLGCIPRFLGRVLKRSVIHVKERWFSVLVLLISIGIFSFKQGMYWKGELSPTLSFGPLQIPIVSSFPWPFLPGAPLPWVQWFGGVTITGLLVLISWPDFLWGRKTWPLRCTILFFGSLSFVILGFTPWW